jgi:hypothetical protein
MDRICLHALDAVGCAVIVDSKFDAVVAFLLIAAFAWCAFEIIGGVTVWGMR